MKPPTPSSLEPISKRAPTVMWSRRLQVLGWWSLALFLVGGVVLEALHGLKLPIYLDVRNSTRRLLWTMAHAHGTLFALVSIVAGHVMKTTSRDGVLGSRWIAVGLLGGMLLVPLGFFLGGLKLVGGDPGPGILLVVPGAALLLLGIGGMALNAGARDE